MVKKLNIRLAIAITLIVIGLLSLVFVIHKVHNMNKAFEQFCTSQGYEDYIKPQFGYGTCLNVTYSGNTKIYRNRASAEIEDDKWWLVQ